jgi:cellulose synthase/poly-beta-1,6-N-acetylglucosamine synthase-like glycosyltransferase
MISSEGGWGTNIPFLANGANMAFRTSAFNGLSKDSFNNKYSSGDDVFLLHTFIREYGNKAIAFAKSTNAIISTPAPQSFSGFLSQRTRWASKAKGYFNSTAFFTALIVLIFNSLFAFSFAMCFFSLYITFAVLLTLLARVLAELPLLIKGLPFYNQKSLLKYYPILLPVYPLYILLASILGCFGNSQWKNRTIK